LVVWSSSGVLDSSTTKGDASTGAIGFGKGLFLHPVTVAFNAGSPNLDLSTGNYFDLTVTGPATLTTSNGALDSVRPRNAHSGAGRMSRLRFRRLTARCSSR